MILSETVETTKSALELQAERETVAFALAMLLVGIAAVGAILLVLVILWGGRTRRISREELAPVRHPDPLDVLRAETRRNTASGQVSDDLAQDEDGSSDLSDDSESDER